MIFRRPYGAGIIYSAKVIFYSKSAGGLKGAQDYFCLSLPEDF